MKTIKFLITAPAVSMIFLLGSCNSDFFTEVNTNPNSPDSVLPASLLSTVEGSIGYSQGGEYSRFSSMFTQQTLGAARQAEGWYNYIFTTQDFDTHWGNMYTQCMENNYLLIQMADEKGYHQYGGIAKILLAYSLQLVVDAWGDVPYTDAFQGLENLHPAFDNGSSVYESLNQLLDEAIDDLNQPVTESLLPGPDDFMYGGDASQWIKFAHAIKARLAIHESKTNATKAQEALDEIAQSFVGNEDNAQLFFGTTSTNAGPWNQFNTQRGDISFSTSTLAGEMSARNDPRYSILIDDAGDPDGLGLAAYYGSPNSPVEFITFDELNFIKAEAILRTSGNIEDAQAPTGMESQRTCKSLESLKVTSMHTSLLTGPYPAMRTKPSARWHSRRGSLFISILKHGPLTAERALRNWLPWTEHKCLEDYFILKRSTHTTGKMFLRQRCILRGFFGITNARVYLVNENAGCKCHALLPASLLFAIRKVLAR